MNYHTIHDLYTTICGAQNRAVSQTGKEPNPTPSLPYRPVSLFDTVARPPENNLLCRVLMDMSDRGVVRNEQFAF